MDEAILRRVAVGTGLVLAGGSGTDTQGVDLAPTPNKGVTGPDTAMVRTTGPTGSSTGGCPLQEQAYLSIRQPWRFGEQLMVEVPRPGYADYCGRTTEQAVTLRITIERTD